MESMAYAEEIVKEFLLFRGFTASLNCLQSEIKSDACFAFRPHSIIAFFFNELIPKYDIDAILTSFDFIKSKIISRVSGKYETVAKKVEISLVKYFLVYAKRHHETEKINSFFQIHGGRLLEEYEEEFSIWFAIPYIKDPPSDRRFRLYFTTEWLESFKTSFLNLLSGVFSDMKLPRLLKFDTERRKVQELEAMVAKLKQECSDLRETVASLKSDPEQVKFQQHSEEADIPPHGVSLNSGSRTDLDSFLQSPDSHGQQQDHEEPNPESAVESASEPVEAVLDFKNLPEISFESKEVFSIHTSSVTRCRFSGSGNEVASSSVDGMVRIWSPDSTLASSRESTLHCSAEVTSLEWEPKADRLLMVGTRERNIKVWDVDSKRLVYDLSSDSAFPRVLDLRCSPSDALFICSSASARAGRYAKRDWLLPIGSLTIWSMRTWKAVGLLSLGIEHPAVTSMCFNHNGKILATAGMDGIIRLFDMVSWQPITGWPAQENVSLSSIRFSQDHSALLTLASNGMIHEWSLHKQGEPLRVHDASHFFDAPEGVPRHEIALSCNGRWLLSTSSQSASPIFDLQDRRFLLTPSHHRQITSVDWHPYQDSFLTSSQDSFIHLTKINSNISSSVA